MSYILAILGFGLLIIVHELGHFIAAKLNGVKVVEFSIGMGPKIFSHKGKETTYALSLLPVGGYVQMLGEEENVDDERSFSAKSPLRRISIILAGVFMNFVMAIVIFSSIFSTSGFATSTLDKVEAGSPAATVGLMPEDKITKVNGSRVFTNSDISVEINMTKGKSIDIEYERAGVKNSVTVNPSYIEDEGRYIIGVRFKADKNPSILASVKESFNQTASLIVQTFKGFKMIFTGEANLKTDVGGPVTIIKMSAGAAKVGIWNLMGLLAILSVSIAVFNLLPFPALDGGWAVILFIELITGRKVPDKIVGVLNTVGFMLLIGIMILVTIKDIIFPISF